MHLKFQSAPPFTISRGWHPAGPHRPRAPATAPPPRGGSAQRPRAATEPRASKFGSSGRSTPYGFSKKKSWRAQEAPTKRASRRAARFGTRWRSGNTARPARRPGVARYGRARGAQKKPEKEDQIVGSPNAVGRRVWLRGGAGTPLNHRTGSPASQGERPGTSGVPAAPRRRARAACGMGRKRDTEGAVQCPSVSPASEHWFAECSRRRELRRGGAGTPLNYWMGSSTYLGERRGTSGVLAASHRRARAACGMGRKTRTEGAVECPSVSLEKTG